jgi:hypothetical protein
VLVTARPVPGCRHRAPAGPDWTNLGVQPGVTTKHPCQCIQRPYRGPYKTSPVSRASATATSLGLPLALGPDCVGVLDSGWT